MVSATVYPGSVKANVIRIARAHGWNTVVWNATSDYRWYGTTRITANNLSSLFSKMLYDYPLQAIFYHGNHVLVIGPRNLP
ncbi:MAG: hypothetical protein HWD59_02380 [Coxiellaceae bacterium]|nr:MAG: hypothetical protein HWD59_02380 [Coxiellaceae bacterium]